MFLRVLIASKEKGKEKKLPVRVLVQRDKMRYVWFLLICCALVPLVRATDEVPASGEQTCTVQDDGTCVEHDEDVVLEAPKQNSAESLVPPLPAPDDEGYVQTKYGEKQKIVSNNEHTDPTTKRLMEMHEYMHSVVYAKEPRHLKQDCLNRHELCTFWASIGECEANPAYMTIQCAPSCLSCDKLLFENRCPLPSNMTDTNILRSGDLNRMFENIASNPYYQEQYGKIDVVLRPGMKSFNTQQVLLDSPWVVVIDDFISEAECETLIQLGAERGYEQSKDVGARKFDGTYDSKQSSGRTSTNAWCQDGCFNHTHTQNVLNKIVNLTGVPDDNSEYLQLLRYEVGQFYETHHDFIEHHVDRAQGVRILTVFLYLNDVEAGGGTNFPVLNVTVMPKRGRVLIWPSVKDSDPSVKDSRTDHQALPVEGGIKYGANAWLHLRDFKAPFKEACI